MAVVVALAGCGKPANLDRDERGLSDNAPPRTGQVGSDKLNLDDPSPFYSLLERLRGPSTFNLHDPKHSIDTARQPLDACKTENPTLSSLFGSKSGTTTTTTTTTTTSSTVPGR